MVPYYNTYKKGISIIIYQKRKNHNIVKLRPYTLYNGVLYKLKPDNILQQSLSPTKAIKVFAEQHEGLVGRHLGTNTTIKKILNSSYWWPTLNKDVAKMCQTYDICQCLRPLWRSDNGPLKPILAFELFMMWGLYFMGQIKPKARYTNNQYIIIAMDYTTRWVEAKAL